MTPKVMNPQVKTEVPDAQCYNSRREAGERYSPGSWNREFRFLKIPVMQMTMLVILPILAAVFATPTFGFECQSFSGENHRGGEFPQPHNLHSKHFKEFIQQTFETIEAWEIK